MIHDLKPYPAYKDSGVPWLGKVPEHWEVQKLKYLTQFYNGLAFKPSDWSNTGIPIIRIQNLNGSEEFNYTTRRDLSKFLIIHPGDLLFSWSGNRGTSFGPFIWRHPFEGYLNQHIFKLDGYKLDTHYFAYLLRAVTKHIEDQTHGIIGLVHITKPELGAVYVSVAPADEQSAIVRYLDHFDRRIRHYIRAKKKLIKLLEEQKQAIIHQAVTRGLDPNVKLKPSGIEWLGEIPEHWEVKPAKWYYREVDERSSTGFEELLSVSHITGVTPRSEKNITMFMAESYVGHKLCREGDLVINTMWAWMAALGIARQTGIVSPSYAVYRPIQKDAFLPQFIDLLLRTKPYVAEYVCRSTGIRSSRLRLYPEKFLSIPIIHPPIAEQQAILDKIYDATSELKNAIHTYNQGISLLREYRTRLIADVVTGKLDVREAAVNLPEKADETGIEDNFEEETTEESLEEFVTEEMVEGEV